MTSPQTELMTACPDPAPTSWMKAGPNPSRIYLDDWTRFRVLGSPEYPETLACLTTERKLAYHRIARMTWMLLLCGSIGLMAFAMRSNLTAITMTAIGAVATMFASISAIREHLTVKRLPGVIVDFPTHGKVQLYDGQQTLDAHRILSFRLTRLRPSRSRSRTSWMELDLIVRLDQGDMAYALIAGRSDGTDRAESLASELASRTGIPLERHFQAPDQS